MELIVFLYREGNGTIFRKDKRGSDVGLLFSIDGKTLVTTMLLTLRKLYEKMFLRTYLSLLTVVNHST